MEADIQQPLDRNDDAQSILIHENDPSMEPLSTSASFEDPQQEQQSVIPVAGFTSAFFYDPYVEIKEFLAALSPAIQGYAAPVDAAAGREANTAEKLLPDTPAVGEHEAGSVQDNASAAAAIVEATPAVGSEANSRDEVKGQTVAGDALREAVSEADRVNESSIDEPKSMADPGVDPSTGDPSNNSASSSSGSDSAATAPVGDEDVSTRETSSYSLGRVGSTTNSSIVDSAVDRKSSIDTPPPKEATEQVDPSNASQELRQQPNQSAPTANLPIQNNPVHSTNSTAAVAPSLGFTASITASFASETKSAWAQLFGAQYEDEVESNTVKSSDPPPYTPSAHQLERGPNSTVSKEISRVSLKMRLDQQIQASRQKLQERTLRNTRGSDPEPQSPTSRLNSHISSITKPTRTPIKPFEHAGLTITNVTSQPSPLPAAPMHPVVAAAMVVTEPLARQDTFYPPPYPDLTPEEESAIFPPPYVNTGPAYWIFDPQIPSPSAAKPGASTSSSALIHPPLYPVHPSPGSPRFSFRKAGADAAAAATPAKDMNNTGSVLSTPAKPRLYKTALSCPPSTPSCDAEMHNQDLDRTQKSSNGSLLDEALSINGKDASAGVMTRSEMNVDDDDDRLEVDMLLALRRQHNMVVNDFMQDILQQQQSRRPTSPDPPPFEYTHLAPERKSKIHHASRPATERNWRSNAAVTITWIQVFKRNLGKKAHSTKKGPPQSQCDAKSVKMSPPVNGSEQPNDEHLAWAVRISEFYSAKRSIDADD